MMRVYSIGVGLLCALLLSACNNEAEVETNAATNGFDKICEVFTLSKNDDTSLSQLDTKLDAVIKRELGERDVAGIAWTAIRNADAAQRYSLFKSAAKETLGRDWECPAMSTLASKL